MATAGGCTARPWPCSCSLQVTPLVLAMQSGCYLLDSRNIQSTSFLNFALVCLPAAAEARSGLHLLEQSLWNAVPQFMRTVSDALKKHTGGCGMGRCLLRATWAGQGPLEAFVGGLAGLHDHRMPNSSQATRQALGSCEVLESGLELQVPTGTCRGQASGVMCSCNLFPVHQLAALTDTPTYACSSSHLHTLAGRDLPLHTQLFKYSSWMGGDRDGNPNVTSETTWHVAHLSRWIATDLYLREVESLHFEVRCGEVLGSGGRADRRQQG